MSLPCDSKMRSIGLPLHLLLGEILAHLPGKVIKAVEGAGVEESVSRLPEDGGHLVVVVGHQLGLGGLLGEREEPVDVLHSLEGFLSQGRNKQNQ